MRPDVEGGAWTEADRGLRGTLPPASRSGRRNAAHARAARQGVAGVERPGPGGDLSPGASAGPDGTVGRHCHVGDFYLSTARSGHRPQTGKSMAWRAPAWYWIPPESAILGQRDNAARTPVPDARGRRRR